jgi:hypothetical protein
MNIHTYLRGIPIDLIPQTIGDAIWTTHACGQQYLWVDAFCIMQDSLEDKNHEISQIPHIFADAYFTIIAARSSKVSEGFLQDYPLAPDVPLPFVCDDGHIGTMRASMPISYDASGEPVNQRAWCLEEYLLSKRSLIYAGNTLQFSCHTVRMNIGLGVRRDYADEQSQIAYSMQCWTQLGSASDNLERTFVWSQIVQDYTSRAVTKYKDKLIALAGVAHRFHDVWDERPQYMAGLWRETVFHDLLWFLPLGRSQGKLVEYRGPSFSWASVDGGVSYLQPPKPATDVVARLSGYEMKLASEILPFGAVTEGSYITIRSRLIKGYHHNKNCLTCVYHLSSPVLILGD